MGRLVFPAGLVEGAERTADIFLVVFTTVPFGLAGPVILASFAAV